ncbi:hypothetical protein BH11ACT2_BH11ACT2_13660 [soil metagenome]
MTWGNRFRLFFGIIIIFAIVAALTIVFSQRKGETMSDSASIQAVDFPIGSDYPGSVIQQDVQVGDQVKKGDSIATIQSNTLLEALKNSTTIASSDVYDIHKDGTLTIKSTVNGIVAKVDVQQGGYAAGGATIATISATDGLYATARYTLDPKDFERVQKGADVDIQLPNSTDVVGKIDSFEVKTVNGQAQAVVKITSDRLRYGGHSGLIAPGTPVQAEMKLKNNDVLASSIVSVRGFVGDLVSAFTG